jgi:dynein light intermediate chain
MNRPQHTSLVKYDNPVLITAAQGKRGGRTAGGNDRQTTQTEDILNSILPPREWTNDGQLWVQYVSSTPATRLDVVTLHEQLNAKLQQRQARETGICPIREELYSQCFDELIRQITINCAERGLLLLRVRDELHMTIAAYQTLYESSIAFGMRKALLAEQKRNDMAAKIRNLQKEKEEKETLLQSLTEKYEEAERKEEERRKEDEKHHEEERDILKKANLQLKQSLEQMLMAPKK